MHGKQHREAPVPILSSKKVVIKLLKTSNIGIDISLKEAVVSLLTWEEKYLGKSFKISNNLPGAKGLEDRLLSILSLGSFEHIRFGIKATNSLRAYNEEYRAYYQRKYREVNKHRHKRALVLTARKLVRLVFALLSENRMSQLMRSGVHNRLVRFISLIKEQILKNSF